MARCSSPENYYSSGRNTELELCRLWSIYRRGNRQTKKSGFSTISYSSVSCCRHCLRCAKRCSFCIRGFLLTSSRSFSRGFSFRKLQIFISQTTDFHFANCKFSFRKLQILISQTTDFHFANYRFPFRFVPFRFAPSRFANYSKPSGRARNTANKHPLLRFHVRNRPCTCRQQWSKWTK